MKEEEAFSMVQIQEKNIEPSQDNSPKLNRNFQLGKIREKTFITWHNKLNQALDWQQFPNDFGGFISKKFGEEELDKMEYALVLSGNIDGFVRTTNQTTISQASVKQTNNTGGIFGNLFGKKAE